MGRTRHHRAARIVATIIAAAVPTAAHAQGGTAGKEHAHQAAFTVGGTGNWTLGYPNIDLHGGLYSVASKGARPSVSEGFVGARFQTGLGTSHVQLAASATFVPKLGGSPEFTTVIQVVPTGNQSRLHVAGGAGIISGRWGSGNRVEPWAQATVAVRTPIHDIAPFVQIGAPLVTGGRAELLLGVSHPLAPYKFHLP
jgi:hypothetical protein